VIFYFFNFSCLEQTFRAVMMIVADNLTFYKPIV